VARVIADGHRHIVVDLTEAELIDCSCIGAILGEVAPLRQEPDAVLLFAGAHGTVARLLDVLEFDRVCDIVETPDEAAALATDPERTTAGGWRRASSGGRA
jgi:anti-anti-sigma factor